MSLLRTARTLVAFWRARRLQRPGFFPDRAALERHQARELSGFLRTLCRRSAWFAPWAGRPLREFPTMDKAAMLAHFDTMNTAGLTLQRALDEAQAAERSRDFQPTLGGITVGLSSGTSGQRGVFAVGPKEQAAWAGILLARALPGRGLGALFAGERAALFLRANSNLYTAVRSRWLQLEFFDLFQPFEAHLAALDRYRPGIVVAPAQVLRALAIARLGGRLSMAPHRVISVAEVLEPQDRDLITQAFGAPHEIYQATEGFLASTCEHGVLHLNEEYVHIEPEWLDAQQRRFVPVVTDFSRLTQPIVRYRLGDVLVARREPCACGRVTRALDRIEGRCDDLLMLPSADAAEGASEGEPGGAPMPVFADLLSRALAQALPAGADYRLVQSGPATLVLAAPLDAAGLERVRDHLVRTLAPLGVDTGALHWQLQGEVPAFDATRKRRRILRLAVDAGGEGVALSTTTSTTTTASTVASPSSPSSPRTAADEVTHA